VWLVALAFTHGYRAVGTCLTGQAHTLTSDAVTFATAVIDTCVHIAVRIGRLPALLTLTLSCNTSSITMTVEGTGSGDVAVDALVSLLTDAAVRLSVTFSMC